MEREEFDGEDAGFELLPADDEGIPAEDDVAAAAASSLEDPFAEDEAADEEAAEPLGKTWLFDWVTGRFVLQGHAPAEVYGVEALRMRCMMALHSAQFAHAVFSDDFGMEQPEDPIGHLVGPDGLADLGRRVSEALTPLEGVAGVENVGSSFDSTAGVISLSFDLLTDGDERVAFPDVNLAVEG